MQSDRAGARCAGVVCGVRRACVCAFGEKAHRLCQQLVGSQSQSPWAARFRGAARKNAQTAVGSGAAVGFAVCRQSKAGGGFVIIGRLLLLRHACASSTGLIVVALALLVLLLSAPSHCARGGKCCPLWVQALACSYSIPSFGWTLLYAYLQDWARPRWAGTCDTQGSRLQGSF